MEKTYIEDRDFNQTDFTAISFTKGIYEGCSFTTCNFSAVDLSGIHFLECTFTGCNLGMAKLVKTAFKDVKFKECKLLGLRFDTCDPFLLEVSFDHCGLNLSSFHGLKLKGTSFKHCTLHEADFSDADLSNSVFDQCDLTGTVFDNTILEKADFRTAYNYTIHPQNNRLKKARFSADGLAGLLQQYDIRIE